MLAMTSVIVDYTFRMCLTFYIIQVGPPNVAGLWLTYSHTLPLDGPECVNNALVNVSKKLTQCFIALKN